LTACCSSDNGRGGASTQSQHETQVEVSRVDDHATRAREGGSLPDDHGALWGRPRFYLDVLAVLVVLVEYCYCWPISSELTVAAGATRTG